MFVAKAAYSIDHVWQLCDRNTPLAPCRQFQWAAINDLRDAALATVVDGGYLLRGGYRLVRRFRPVGAQ